MAIVLIDGFDTYNGVGSNLGYGTKWVGSNNGYGSTSGMVSGRFGGQALAIYGGTGTPYYVNRPLPTNYTQFTVGAALYFVDYPRNDVTFFMSFYDGSGLQCGIGFDWNLNRITVGRSDSYIYVNTPLGYSGGNSLYRNTWMFIEAEVVFSNTVGRITVYRDGEMIANVTNIDTVATTNSYANLVRFLTPYANSELRIDDMYVCDTATRIGERRVETLRVSADTAQKQFTASTGVDNYALLDESVAVSTDYVSSSTVGQHDLYETVDMSTTPTAISAVQVSTYAKKNDSATRAIGLTMKSDTTISVGPDFYLPTSFTKQDRIVELDPATGLAWTTSAINALQIGPKVTI